MGTLRDMPEPKDHGKVVGVKDFYGNRIIPTPQSPAHILLDDIEEVMVVDSSGKHERYTYSYEIQPYPESHHI